MSQIKWIKITTDMFEDEKIDFIDSLPDKDTILILWIKLLTLSGKINDRGLIYLTPEIPYTEEMLSHKFKRPINTVKLAIETFKRLGMIYTIDDGHIAITNWEKHQSIEKMEKIREQTRTRMFEYRKRITRKELKFSWLDGGICQYCGDKATGFDHIVPLSSGGTDDIENLVDCCKRCNNIKSNRSLNIFLSDIELKVNPFINRELALSNPKLRKCYADVTQQNKNKNKNKNKENTSSKVFNDDALNFSDLLLKEILKNNPHSRLHACQDADKEKIIQRWAKDIDLLIRIDGQEPSTVEEVIRWCQQDGFWRANILSGKKLREKWDTLVAQKNRVSIPAQSRSKNSKEADDDRFSFLKRNETS